MIVKQIMSPLLHTVTPDMPVTELGRYLARHDISGAPVLEEGRLIGVVSRSDLADLSPGPGPTRDRPSRPHYFRELWLDEGAPEASPSSATVRDIMTPVVYSIREDESLEALVELMLRSRIHRVVVVARGGPSGVVTTSDLVRLIPQLLRQAGHHR